MLKVMTIAGTRPEIIRLSRIIATLDRHVEHILVHTGQNYTYELGGIFFDELGIRPPDHMLAAAGGSGAATIARVIERADALFVDSRPDAVLILGDTDSALAAVAAKRRQIPIFHMEAGNRCFDFRVPEEVNRRIVDHLADVNLPYTQRAREYLVREGLPPDRIIVTGSPLREVIDHHAPAVSASDVLARLGLEARRYFLGSIHRAENVDDPARLARLLRTFGAVSEAYGLPVLLSTHPRTETRLRDAALALPEGVQLAKPFGFIDWLRLQTEARAVLSDSGTITEESSILDFPALNLRETHERPEGFEEGAVMMTGIDEPRVLDCLSVLDGRQQGRGRALPLVADYAPTNVSEKILRILLSYTDVVNREVWRRG